MSMFPCSMLTWQGEGEDQNSQWLAPPARGPAIGGRVKRHTYRAVHPRAAGEIPQGLWTHRVSEDGTHALALTQLAEHAAHRGARHALLISGVGQECGPCGNATDADCEEAGPCALHISKTARKNE